ncbi:hypothetical protein [Methanobacterium sp. ACI-7]|uniref:hypothetical protein n=1 Tax=unclassified Methanobacterium TaxID=2627676 RepID=UPI0039C1A39F
MSSNVEWIVKCDSCGKEYEISDDWKINTEACEDYSSLKLDNALRCPYCNSENYNLPRIEL